MLLIAASWSPLLPITVFVEAAFFIPFNMLLSGFLVLESEYKSAPATLRVASRLTLELPQLSYCIVFELIGFIYLLLGILLILHNLFFKVALFLIKAML